MKIKLTKFESKEANSAAEALYDLVNENFCDIVGNCDHKIVSRLICPEPDDEEFVDEFETQVYKRFVKKLVGNSFR